MLKLIKRWLGWDDGTGMFDFSSIEPPRRPSSATASVLTHGPRVKKRKPAAQQTKGLSLDRGSGKPQPAFDPYNTGKFDRSASWERISRNQR